jgi:DNA-binding MarR family transcriptional regulator
MSDPKDLKLSNYQALAEFRYQIRRFLHFSEQVARESGVEPQQHQLMLAVKGAPDGAEPRIGYLAERLQIQHHSAVELTDRLVRKGLIQKVRSSDDRREVHVRLTSTGERVLRELTVHNRAELRSAAPALVAALRRISSHTHTAAKRKTRAATA